jgi:hypothetical protein
MATDWNPNGDTIPANVVNSRYRIEATNNWIGNSVAYTLDMKTFDHNELMTKMAGDLASSVAIARQKAALKPLNDGFTGKWCTDAAVTVPLFSTTHPLDPRLGTPAVTASNLVVGAPSIATLSDAINLLVATPDDLGNQGTYLPRFVLCHTNKYLEWKQILGNDSGRSDTPNHTPNPFTEYRINPVACPWIDDEDKWFLFSDKTPLVWNDVISFKSLLSTEPKTQVTTHMAYACFTQYARDWRGIVASQG